MAGSVNKVILIGNLGADPEMRRTQDGRPIANLSVATSETWRDKATGERREKTEWHRVVIFNEGLCRIAEQYLKKGSKVYLEGALQTRKWTDQQGVEQILDRGGPAEFQCAAHDARSRRRWRRARGRRMAVRSSAHPGPRRARGNPRPPERAASVVWTTKSRSRKALSKMASA